MNEKVVAVCDHDGTEFIVKCNKGKYTIVQSKDVNVQYLKDFTNEKDAIEVAEMLFDAYNFGFENGVTDIIEANEMLEDDLY